VNRLVHLHLRSRRVPLVLLLIVVTAVILRAVKPWTETTGEFAALLPLVLAVAAAGLVASSTRSPFGDPEHATYPLRRLRLVQVLILVAVSMVLLGVTRIGDDPLATMRNVAGFTGLALLTTPFVGASLAWITPLAYTIYCGGPVDVREVDLWTWPALPSSDTTAAVIALVLLSAGLIVITRLGSFTAAWRYLRRRRQRREQLGWLAPSTGNARRSDLSGVGDAGLVGEDHQVDPVGHAELGE
jgi:hypothetical protein